MDPDELKSLLKDIFKDRSFLGSLIEESVDTSAVKRPSAQDQSPVPAKKKKVLKTSNVNSSDRQPNSSSFSGQAGSSEVESPAVGGSASPKDGVHSPADPEGILEQLLAQDSDEIEYSEEEEEEDSSKEKEDAAASDSDDLEVLGGDPEASWNPDKKVLDWYLKVADIELKPENLKKLKEAYKSSSDHESHFSPPRFSPGIWNAITSGSSHADSYRLKTINKAQDKLYLALKPLLSVLSKCNKGQKSELTSAIQLLCSANLTLNRYRRATCTPYLKKEIRKQMLSLPVTHDALFGPDFTKYSDTVLKEQAALQKVFVTKAPVKQRLSFKSTPLDQPSTSKADYQVPFRGRGRGRGKGRGRGGRRAPAVSPPPAPERADK